jgi:hypothetical protein
VVENKLVLLRRQDCADLVGNYGYMVGTKYRCYVLALRRQNSDVEHKLHIWKAGRIVFLEVDKHSKVYFLKLILFVKITQSQVDVFFVYCERKAFGRQQALTERVICRDGDHSFATEHLIILIKPNLILDQDLNRGCESVDNRHNLWIVRHNELC